ncbi:MAG: hypothetical protein WBE14_13525, partial [Xanthobacteraceae bacterium]
ECVYLNAFDTGSEARTGIGRRQDARRGLCYAGNRGEIGGVIEPRIHLSQAAILFRKTGPPLTNDLPNLGQADLFQQITHSYIIPLKIGGGSVGAARDQLQDEGRKNEASDD